MKKKQPRKMTLTRETVRRLDDDRLKEVAGAEHTSVYHCETDCTLCSICCKTGG